MRNQMLKPHHRNRAVNVLLLPVVAILFLLGWSLFWLGSYKRLAEQSKADSSR